jgi:hypothetical protein
MPVALERFNATRAKADVGDEAREAVRARYRRDYEEFGY